MRHSSDRPTGDPVKGPTTCPVGNHPLGPRQVLVGWSPCGCPEALNNHGGHRTHQCVECLNLRVKTVCYTPPHLGGRHPVDIR